MTQQPGTRTFSPGWIVISYFLICGGIVIGLIGAAYFLSNHELISPRIGGYLACGVGAGIGGFYAGRASHHFSVLEPALAGALVIGSIFALVKWTALGPLAFAYAQEAIVRESLILGGLAFGGGLLGAVLGGSSTNDSPPKSLLWLRWVGMTVLITAGALLVAMVGANILLADQALQDPETWRKVWANQNPISEEAIQTTAILALASGSALAGAVAQLAAPIRMLMVCAVGVFFTIAGGFLGLLLLTERLDRDTLVGSLVIGAAAGAAGLVGAIAGWLVRRMLGLVTGSAWGKGHYPDPASQPHPGHGPGPYPPQQPWQGHGPYPPRR